MARIDQGRGRAQLAGAGITAVLWVVVAALPGCNLAVQPPGQPAPPEDDGLYYLPFEAGFATIVPQGNWGIAGQGSHLRKYAIDFAMPVGTRILAARSGVVDRIRDDCPNVNCPFDEERCCGNFVRIRHADGTAAAYWHLVQFGSCVTVGQRVARGDVIGRSGNTGISLAPHLHFMVFAAEGGAGTGAFGPSRDGSMEVAFEDVQGSGVPALLMTVQSRNTVGHDWCAE